MVTLYTTLSCPYCHAAKDLLKRKGIAFREIDVSDDAEFGALIRRTGWKTVPQIFIGEKMIGGCRELTQMDSKGFLDNLSRKANP